MARDYFARRRVRIYFGLDADSVEEHYGDGFEVESDDHPHALIKHPTHGDLTQARRRAEEQPEDVRDLMLLTATVGALGGDPRLLAGDWRGPVWSWPSLDEDDAFERRLDALLALDSVDVAALARAATDKLNLSDEERGN